MKEKEMRGRGMERLEKTQKYLESYLANYKNYKDYWNYEDGCTLKAARDLYELTGDEKYIRFILDYLSGCVNEEGRITNYEDGKYNIDSVNSGKCLFAAYDYTKEEKYKNAIEQIMDQVRTQPRCKCGNFFHKKIYPNQIWLDGLYMAQPFYMEYETRFHNREGYTDIVSQFENVQKYLLNEEKGLCYHGYDESKSIFWADKETGCSKNFWLRSMGWYLMALVDVIDHMDSDIYESYHSLLDIYRKMIAGILPYMDDETGLFYDVIDRPDAEGNYLETSGSSMVAYAILKGCNMGILLKEKYLPLGKWMMESLMEKMLVEREDGFHLGGIVSVSGLGPADNERRDGSVEYYLSEPVVEDDPKGVGCFFMAYAQYLKACEK